MYKKVFLILDNLSVHISKDVKEWIKKHKDAIEIFYLPAYAPEYNPDENINSSLKRVLSMKKLAIVPPLKYIEKMGDIFCLQNNTSR